MTTESGKDSRINMRISNSARQKIERAAQLSQQDLSGFVLGAALDKARRIALETSLVKLSERDFFELQKALQRDEEPSEILIKLMQSEED